MIYKPLKRPRLENAKTQNYQNYQNYQNINPYVENRHTRGTYINTTPLNTLLFA